jgi:HEAT repeat protein
MMRKLFSSAARGRALVALSFLLAVGVGGNAQGERRQGQTGPTDSAKGLSRLMAALKDRSYWPDQYRAANALGELGPAARDAVPALAEALKDPEYWVRMAAARALGKVGSLSATPKALAALKAAAKDKDPEVRDAVTLALEDLMSGATAAHVAALVVAMKDTEPLIRRAAARALGKISSVSPRSGSAAAQALAALKAAAKDKDPEVRRAATEAWQAIPPSFVMLALEPPLVEAYLHQGRLTQGEDALSERLKTSPRDDQARFGLGVLRFVRGVERLGQSLYKYGARSENTNIPFVRLPVPENPHPAPITYTAFRRVLDDFHRDLAAAEAALAGISDDKVQLPLRLAAVRLDLAGDGKSTDRFIDILKKMLQRQRFDLLQSNPEFVVAFDRGDVAWLRAYCHLLMGMLDFYLAFDTERLFDEWAGRVFAKPEKRGADAAREPIVAEAWMVLAVKERARLGQFRKHLVRVAELNRETWKYIRAETDDDHEWLPNPRQKGVLGLPVQDERIDAWLAMMAELGALLEGKRTLTFEKENNVFVKDDKGLNLKTLFDDPPEKLLLDVGFLQTLPNKYFSERSDVDSRVLTQVIGILFLGDPTAVAYAAWFN